MTGRTLRRLLLVAAIAGVGYWIYQDQPTASGIIDTITSPLMGSKAAVKSSERNRVTGDATAAISEQTDSTVAVLHEGMTIAEVRELLGPPEKYETVKVDGVYRQRWTYSHPNRVLMFQDGRVISIVLR